MKFQKNRDENTVFLHIMLVYNKIRYTHFFCGLTDTYFLPVLEENKVCPPLIFLARYFL